MNSLQPVLHRNKRLLATRSTPKWMSLAVLGALYILAGAVAPPIEALMGAWT